MAKTLPGSFSLRWHKNFKNNLRNKFYRVEHTHTQSHTQSHTQTHTHTDTHTHRHTHTQLYIYRLFCGRNVWRLSIILHPAASLFQCIFEWQLFSVKRNTPSIFKTQVTLNSSLLLICSNKTMAQRQSGASATRYRIFILRMYPKFYHRKENTIL